MATVRDCERCGTTYLEGRTSPIYNGLKELCDSCNMYMFGPPNVVEIKSLKLTDEARKDAAYKSCCRLWAHKDLSPVFDVDESEKRAVFSVDGYRVTTKGLDCPGYKLKCCFTGTPIEEDDLAEELYFRGE